MHMGNPELKESLLFLFLFKIFQVKQQWCLCTIKTLFKSRYAKVYLELKQRLHIWKILTKYLYSPDTLLLSSVSELACYSVPRQRGTEPGMLLQPRKLLPTSLLLSQYCINAPSGRERSGHFWLRKCARRAAAMKDSTCPSISSLIRKSVLQLLLFLSLESTYHTLHKKDDY